MESKIVIFGAGGHTRSLIPLLNQNGFNVTAIYDNSYKPEIKEIIGGIPVVGELKDYNKDQKIVLSYGDGKVRENLLKQYQFSILEQNLFHTTAIIEKSAKFGKMNQIFAGTIINSDVTTGENNIINTGAIIEHEVKIGNFNHISVGSIIAGRVELDNYCFIGAGAVVIDKIKITSNVTIGANAVVIEDIVEPGTYVGNPARKIK